MTDKEQLEEWIRLQKEWIQAYKEWIENMRAMRDEAQSFAILCFLISGIMGIGLIWQWASVIKIWMGR